MQNTPICLLWTHFQTLEKFRGVSVSYLVISSPFSSTTGPAMETKITHIENCQEQFTTGFYGSWAVRVFTDTDSDRVGVTHDSSFEFQVRQHASLQFMHSPGIYEILSSKLMSSYPLSCPFWSRFRNLPR